MSTPHVKSMEEHKESVPKRRDQKKNSKYYKQVIQSFMICSLVHKCSFSSLLHEKHIPPHPKKKYLPKAYLIMSLDPKSKIYADSFCTWSICGSFWYGDLCTKETSLSTTTTILSTCIYSQHTVGQKGQDNQNNYSHVEKERIEGIYQLLMLHCPLTSSSFTILSFQYSMILLIASATSEWKQWNEKR